MLVLALLLCAASVGTGATREKTDIEYNWTDLLKESGADLDSVQERLVADAGLQVRPEILEASNVTAEILHWKKKRLPQVLEFPGGIGYIVETVPTTIQKVDFNKGIGFHFFSKYDEEDIEGFKMVDDVKDPAALRTAGWNEELPVKVITHGFMDYIGADSIQSIKNAYLKTGNFNVIGVDWGRAMGRAASGSWYPWARCSVPFVGARLGRFLDSLIEAQLTEPKMLHVVGHGLGAHVAGIAGKSMTVEDPVARITGLDPAGPLFHFTAKDGHIADSDAQVVDVIHTNAGMLGKAEILGDVDFYPNGGTFQKGCHQDASGTCSHRRAVELFVRTILTSESYEGVFCSAVPATRPPKECMRSARENLPEAVMGNKVSFSKSGPYFVNLKWD